MGIHIPLPHIPLPDLPGPIKDLFDQVGDFVNPFTWFGKALMAVYNLEAWFVQTMLLHPPRVGYTKATDYLYGNAVGMAGYLAMIVTTICLCMAMVYVKGAFRAAEAVAITLVVAFITPGFFWVTDTLVGLGDSLSQAALVMQEAATDDHPSLFGFVMDAAINPMLLISAYLPTSLLAAACCFVVFTYEILNVLIRFLWLPSFALRPLGTRFKDFNNWLTSAGMVSMVFGRPAMLLCLEVSRALAQGITQGSSAAMVYFMCAGMALGLYLQIVLYRQAKRITGKVFGSTNIGKIWGTVNTQEKNRIPVMLGAAQASHRSSMAPVPVASGESRPSKTRQAGQWVSAESKAQAKKAFAKKAAALTAGKAATAAAGVASGGTTLAVGAAMAGASAANGARHAHEPRNTDTGNEA
jgi:hypothetical protein